MSDDVRSRLSEDLWPIFDHEIDRGNEVAEELFDVWEACPYQVIFDEPLDLEGILELDLSSNLTQYSETDPHYPNLAGFFSEATRHCVSGPQTESGLR